MFRNHLAHAAQRTLQPSTLFISRARLLSTTQFRRATKDAQHKDTLKPTSTEYSKSGSDDAAAHTDTAFNPNETRPAEEEASAEREAGGKENSLGASPANKDISEPDLKKR